MNKEIINEVGNYYSDKIKHFGATPAGVDWNGTASQELRFKQLLQVVPLDTNNSTTLLDYGCGYGSLLQYIKEQHQSIAYTGFDIASEMIEAAKQQHPKDATWLTSLPQSFAVDYTIASGIFNVKQHQTEANWEQYILDTLTHINSISTKGFAFNVLTSYSDKEYMKDYLYYANPLVLFDFCKRHFSRNIALLHDYELYEFTLIIRK
jgi:SAM-dependent methyltransferase